MTGAELKRLRMTAGLTLMEMARAMGYEGSDENENRRIRRLEAMTRLPRDAALRAHAVALDSAVVDLRRRAISNKIGREVARLRKVMNGGFDEAT